MYNRMQNRLQQLALVLLSLLCATGQVTGDEKDTTTEIRRHYVLSDAEEAVIGEMTTISRWGDDNGMSVLYQSVAGDSLVLEWVVDSVSQEQVVTIRDVSGDAWIASRTKNPFIGKEIVEVVRAAGPDGINLPQEIVLENDGGEWHGTEHRWESGNERQQLTMDLRRTLSFSLLEMIEREAGRLFATEDAALANETIVRYVLYRTECKGTPPAVDLITPDCSFDAAFGFPCNEKQRERAREAKNTDSTATQY